MKWHQMITEHFTHSVSTGHSSIKDQCPLLRELIVYKEIFIMDHKFSHASRIHPVTEYMYRPLQYACSKSNPNFWVLIGQDYKMCEISIADAACMQKLTS
jgi:hypothetical protein